jgi:hypothetical protein
MIAQLRRSIWIAFRILWRRWQYRREIAITPPPYPVTERRFPIAPSRMGMYAQAADDIFYRQRGVPRQYRAPVPRATMTPQPQSPR